MKKTIEDFKLNDKKVIIRVDFNVPIKDGVITDDNRIVESLPTIKYAIANKAKVILLSHLGRVKEESDLIKNDLKPVSVRLSELLNQKVTFVPFTRGNEVENTINKMNDGDVVLLQNTRYEDLDGKKESSNDSKLGKYWASLGDIFINDAFGTAHRAHASNVGIASYLPSGVGYLMKKEIDNITPVLHNPTRPFTVILGGSKVSDKIGVIKNLVTIADYILIGGGMAYTFLYSEGYGIGSSLLDKDNVNFCKEMLTKYKDKIILPVDTITGLAITDDTTINTRYINEIPMEEIGLDIGPKTVELFDKYIKNSKTVVWNGPMGVFEIAKFSVGTKKILEALKGDKTVIIGGGDTAAAAIKMGYKNTFTHISTGGGASLEMLEGKSLPGIDAIDNK